MKFKTGKDYLKSTNKAVALIGMSGVGKTYLSHKLRETDNWSNYSVDLRIGSKYLRDNILENAENIKERDFAEQLLVSENLAPLSEFLGKPGDVKKGGIPIKKYFDRQRLHRNAEISSLNDASAHMDAARYTRKYGTYSNFVCDTGGSITEVVDPDDMSDEVLVPLARQLLIVYIKSSSNLDKKLAKRFDEQPKPMYYEPSFLKKSWEEYITHMNVAENSVDPDHFIRWGFKALIARRKPIYQRIAKNWGIEILASDVESIKNADEFNEVIAAAIDVQENVLLDTYKFGEAIFRRRERMQITRTYVSKRLDISNNKLKKIELGIRQANPDLEKQLFHLLFSKSLHEEYKSEPRTDDTKLNTEAQIN